MGYQKIVVPADGSKITVNADLSLNVPNHPIIPFIEGDGIGVDITPTIIFYINRQAQSLLMLKIKILALLFHTHKFPKSQIFKSESYYTFSL